MIEQITLVIRAQPPARSLGAAVTATATTAECLVGSGLGVGDVRASGLQERMRTGLSASPQPCASLRVCQDLGQGRWPPWPVTPGLHHLLFRGTPKRQLGSFMAGAA